MRKYIDSLSEKPDHKKKQIAFAVSSGCMVVIAGIWLMTFSVRFSPLYILTRVDEIEASQEEFVQEAQRSQAASPFESLQNNLDVGFEDLMKSNEAGVQVESSTNNIPQQQDSFISNDVIITDPGQVDTDLSDYSYTY
ncbi:MAG: hypothetical protein V4519_04170 [Patescibacteria group bacterium]